MSTMIVNRVLAMLLTLGAVTTHDLDTEKIMDHASLPKPHDNLKMRPLFEDSVERIGSLQQEILAAKRETLKRQKQEQIKATKVDQDAVAEARTKFVAIRGVIADMQQTRGGGMLVVIPRASGRAKGPLEVVVTPGNAQQKLAEAYYEYSRARKPEIPPELQMRHQRELRGYRILQESVANLEALCDEANGALQQINESEVPAVGKRRWGNTINERVAEIRSKLINAQEGNWSEEPIEPLGYSIVLGPRVSRFAPAAKKAVVVEAVVRSKLFRPSRETGVTHQAEPSRGGNDNVLTLNRSRFRLVLKDGRTVPAAGFKDPPPTGSRVIATSAAGCTVRFEAKPSAVIRLQIVWILDREDTRPPFKLQLDNFEPLRIDMAKSDSTRLRRSLPNPRYLRR